VTEEWLLWKEIREEGAASGISALEDGEMLGTSTNTDSVAVRPQLKYTTELPPHQHNRSIRPLMVTAQRPSVDS
jgi:hypothetical protein